MWEGEKMFGRIACSIPDYYIPPFNTIVLNDEHKEQITFLNSSTLLGFLNICGNDHTHVGSCNNKY